MATLSVVLPVTFHVARLQQTRTTNTGESSRERPWRRVRRFMNIAPKRTCEDPRSVLAESPEPLTPRTLARDRSSHGLPPASIACCTPILPKNVSEPLAAAEHELAGSGCQIQTQARPVAPRPLGSMSRDGRGVPQTTRPTSQLCGLHEHSLSVHSAVCQKTADAR